MLILNIMIILFDFIVLCVCVFLVFVGIWVKDFCFVLGYYYFFLLEIVFGYFCYLFMLKFKLYVFF